MPNPNSPVFPGAIPDNNVLPVATDTLFVTLSSNIDNVQTSGIVLSAGGFNTPAVLVIDDEIILVKTLSGSTVTLAVRGFAGSAATTHTAGTSIFGYIVAYHHNQIIAELVAIATSLGVSLANVISNGQAAGGDLAGTYPNPTVATFNGINGTQLANTVANSHAQNTDVGTGVSTVTFSATPVFDLDLGGIQKITLTGNVTSSTLTNLRVGQVTRFAIIQNAGGGHTFVWPANVFGGMVIGGASNAKNIQLFTSYDGVSLYAETPGVTY